MSQTAGQLVTETLEPERLLERAPSEVVSALEALLEEGEQELIRVDSDFTAELKYGRRWVVVTSRRALVLSVVGDLMADVDIEDLAVTRVDSLVGGSQLTMERKTAPTIRFAYSSTEAVRP
ncbi:uncharacterized protein METZ01_LOCUS161436, partial [marine metagenome]